MVLFQSYLALYKQVAACVHSKSIYIIQIQRHEYSAMQNIRGTPDKAYRMTFAEKACNGTV